VSMVIMLQKNRDVRSRGFITTLFFINVYNRLLVTRKRGGTPYKFAYTGIGLSV
jgi:hypothetical protein